jgi:hypothetical protein
MWERQMPFLYGKMSAFDIDLFKNKSRIRSTRGERTNSTPVEHNTWTQEVPRTRHLSAYEPTTKTYIPSARRLTLERKLEEKVIADGLANGWKNNRQASFDHKLHFVVRRNEQGELRCYYHRDIYEFVEVNPDGVKLRYSNPYKGKELALSKFRRGRIFWAGDFTVPKGNKT